MSCCAILLLSYFYPCVYIVAMRKVYFFFFLESKKQSIDDCFTFRSTRRKVGGKRCVFFFFFFFRVRVCFHRYYLRQAGVRFVEILGRTSGKVVKFNLLKRSKYINLQFTRKLCIEGVCKECCNVIKKNVSLPFFLR